MFSATTGPLDARRYARGLKAEREMCLLNFFRAMNLLGEKNMVSLATDVNGRDETGRFSHGNSFARGNQNAKRVQQMRTPAMLCRLASAGVFFHSVANRPDWTTANGCGYPGFAG